MTRMHVDRELVTDPTSNGQEARPARPVQAPRRSRGLTALALLLLALAGAWAYWTNVKTARPAMDMNMRISAGASAFPVVVAPVERGGVRGTVVYTGSVAPFNEEDVYPRVMGRIVEMPVYPGDVVRAGQVVARLDDVELTSRVREAEAMAATAEVNRHQMEADLLAARHGVEQMQRELAMVEAELAYASGVRARSEQLVASGAISRQEYENDRSMAASLEARREAARARLEQARAMETAARLKRQAADSMLAQNVAAAQTAQIVRDYVNITAPGGGWVVKRLVAPGVLVQPGVAILKMAQIDRVRLQANVGEKDVASLRPGAPVKVTTVTGKALDARVTAVFPFVDQGSRTAVVEAVVPNGDRALLPGQFVTMEFVTGERRGVLTVPRSAVSRMGGTARVWIVRDGEVEPREVQLGLEGPERVEVLAGLDEGDDVVTRGHESLYARARVATPGAAGAAPPGSRPAAHSGHGTHAAPAPTESKGHAGH